MLIISPGSLMSNATNRAGSGFCVTLVPMLLNLIKVGHISIVRRQ